MRTHPIAPSASHPPTEDEIRAYAHELYIRSGWLPGRDLDNWLEAEAWLRAHPPAESPRSGSGPVLHAKPRQH